MFLQYWVDEFGSLEHCLSSFLCSFNIGMMSLSIAELPFDDDAGLEGERTNFDVPLEG